MFKKTIMTNKQESDQFIREFMQFFTLMMTTFIFFTGVVVFLQDKNQPYLFFFLAIVLFTLVVLAFNYSRTVRTLTAFYHKHNVIKEELEYAVLDIKNNNALAALTTLEGILGYPVFAKRNLTNSLPDDVEVI